MKRLVSLAGVLTTGAIAVAAAGAGPDTVTIAAHPGIIRWPEGTALAGRVSSGEAGELVRIEGKECPARSFREVAFVRTTAGGTWAAEAGPETKTVLRARWRGALSREVVVLVRPHLVLGQISLTRFRAHLRLGNAANGKRLVLQWFESKSHVWKRIRTVVFRNSGPAGYPQMTISASPPKGALLRLTLPRAEAQPCHLAGYSNLLQT
jgi:hypothetical protein